MNLKDLTDISQQFGFSRMQLRHMIKYRKDTGLDKHVFKIGEGANAKIYIDPEGFEKWLESKRDSYNGND